MVAQVKACSVCRESVRLAIANTRVPCRETKRGTVSTFTMNITSPSQWNDASLMTLCWRAIEFKYHRPVYIGNTVACSNAR